MLALPAQVHEASELGDDPAVELAPGRRRMPCSPSVGAVMGLAQPLHRPTGEDERTGHPPPLRRRDRVVHPRLAVDGSQSSPDPITAVTHPRLSAYRRKAAHTWVRSLRGPMGSGEIKQMPAVDGVGDQASRDGRTTACRLGARSSRGWRTRAGGRCPGPAARPPFLPAAAGRPPAW